MVAHYYWQEVDSTRDNINILIKEMHKQRENLANRKESIVNILKEKKIIKKEQINEILEGKFGLIKWMIKKALGVYK